MYGKPDAGALRHRDYRLEEALIPGPKLVRRMLADVRQRRQVAASIVIMRR